MAHLLPPRRLRSQPRVVKRKMSNYRLKRAHHRNRPQPRPGLHPHNPPTMTTTQRQRHWP
ncbi:hypothetical protein GEV43_10285 [Actinomadura sp. J1-007]|nr:hypothetical protein [Actinomadura sp. J1-007]